MAVRDSTPVNIVIGAGDLLVDEAHRGATAGDNLYRIEQSYFVPTDINGVKGELLGTRYKTDEHAIIETMLPELAEDVLVLLLPGFTGSDVGSDRVIRSDATRRIPTADYHDYELRVPRITGGHFGFHAENALATANAEFSAKDKGMSEPKISVQSTWDPANLNLSPHFIVIASSGS